MSSSNIKSKFNELKIRQIYLDLFKKSNSIVFCNTRCLVRKITNIHALEDPRLSDQEIK
jgi:hypothetical protein